jgi:CubicO group peptidase (beta-lactamase class C family)
VTIDLSASEIRAAIALAEAQLDYEQRHRKIPGLSAGIVYDQALIWSHGYGYANVEKQIPADARSVYRCASITKLFTSTMMMMLRDAGKLNLDDPLEKYAPEFRISSPYADAHPATFRMVSSHAAGLPREGDHEGWADLNMLTAEELLGTLEHSEMLMPTMTEPKYSNLGIAMLGYTLSKIAGQPFTEFVKEHILMPLGMMDTGFERSPYTDEHYAHGYNKEGVDKFTPAPDWNPRGWIPAGGIYSTIADISKFISLQFSDAPAGATPSQILGTSTLREMHMPVNVAPDFKSAFGLGFGVGRVANQKIIGHSGSVPGYRTNISMVPALKLGVSVFTNTSTDPIAITDKVLETLVPAFEHQMAEPEATPEQIAAWKPYMGRYKWLSFDDIVDIRMVKGYLTALMIGEAPETFVKLKPAGEHQFKMVGGHSANEPLRFTLDERGRVTGLWFGGYPFKRTEEE